MTHARYRKKPVAIEALLFTGKNWDDVHYFFGASRWHRPFVETTAGNWTSSDTLSIPTLEGDMIANPGDWIIKGVANEFYPCKPDIFAATYEPAEAEVSTTA